jgi:hypothetical protein
MQHKRVAAVTPKSPLIPPFCKGGIFFATILTPLWKRGEGEIFGSSDAEIIQRISDTPH